MRGGHNRKVTPAQRDDLLRLHLAGDREAATALALQIGLHPNYAMTYANRMGHKPIHKPTPTQHRWVNA
jgi:hypothetical protein